MNEYMNVTEHSLSKYLCRQTHATMYEQWSKSRDERVVANVPETSSCVPGPYDAVLILIITTVQSSMISSRLLVGPSAILSRQQIHHVG